MSALCYLGTDVSKASLEWATSLDTLTTRTVTNVVERLSLTNQDSLLYRLHRERPVRFHAFILRRADDAAKDGADVRVPRATRAATRSPTCSAARVPPRSHRRSGNEASPAATAVDAQADATPTMTFFDPDVQRPVRNAVGLRRLTLRSTTGAEESSIGGGLAGIGCPQCG